MAVSGGGIRSATFALGFFEAFAKHRLLRRIDYLSTVSGGGYLGAFIGRFFCRDYIRGVRDVEWVLGGPEQESHPAADPELADARNSAVAWLRENGKYLAPQGSADLLLALSAMLRNWVAVQGIIGTALLSLFLALRIPEVFVYWSLQAPPSHRLIVEAQRWVAALKVQLPFQSVLWWSWCVLLPIAAAIGAFAVGWAYWLVIDNPRRSHPRAIAGGLLWAATIAFAASHGPHDVWQTAPIAVLIVLAAGAVTSTLAAPLDGVPLAILTGIVAARSDVGPVAQNIAILLTVTGSLALVFVAFAKWWPAQSGAATTSDEAALLAGQLARNRLTVMLRSWVAVTAVVLLIAIVDAAGRHAYAMSAEGHLKAWMSGLVAFGTLFASYARKLFSLAAPNTGGKRPGMPVSVLATGAAVIIVLGLLLGYDIAANAVTWNFGCAAEPAQASPKTKLTVNAALTRGASTVVLTTVVSEPTCGDASSCAPIERTPFALWLIGSILLTFAFGRAYGFLNFSSHQVMYSARLTRSYLGASNPARWTQSAPPVTDTVAEDDIEVHKYWPVPPAHAPVPSTERTPYDRGAPLHIVNVTVNETFGGRSQIQQRDRKGIGMALGPGGMSVGVRQHVVYAEDAARASGGGHIRRISEVFPQGGTDFKVFDFDPPRPREFPVEPLSLGRWIGISGAAVSTGVGYRTSPGLSLLAGLANVRLGYWWDSGVRRRWAFAGRRRAGPLFSRAIVKAFPVHAYLAYELAAHFPGTSRRHWYLSDGGHFENMGGYELIRRRLPLVIVLDAEADEDYTFEGMANLVRKARLDFGTEIDFEHPGQFDCDPLKFFFSEAAFGTLADLRPVPCNGPVLDARHSRKRAATATIRYPDGSTGCLVYVKPTVCGDEPLDLREYARHNPPFPQQSTADQFFDEAQWESYRKLGEHIGDQLLV